ncbi:uncharacterized protein LOC142351425 [Convolutriloba macropyga]|uniref:uncharacterized protein LOC142351425 n=1 Tax=Convolutriloba macropyga TaxID=536237 RepID=UPI003F524BFE
MSDKLFAEKSEDGVGENGVKQNSFNASEENLSDLTEASETISEIIEAENINLKAHIQDQAQRITELKRANSDWSRKFELANQSKAAFESQLDVLLQEFDEYRTEKESLISSLTEEKVDLIKQMREKRENSLKDRQSRLQSISDSEKASKELLDKLKVKNQDLLVKVAEQNLTIEDLKKQNKMISDQFSSLKTEIENTKNNRLSNDRRIKTLSVENERLENCIDDLKKETESMREKLEVLKENRTSLKSELAERKKDHLQEVEKMNNEIQNLRDSKRAGKMAFEAQKLEYKNVLKDNKIEISELKIQLEVEKRNVKSLNDEIEKLRDENRLKSAQIRAFNDRIKEIENDPNLLFHNQSNEGMERAFSSFIQQPGVSDFPRNSISSQFMDSGLGSPIPTESSRKSSREQSSKVEDFLKYKYSSNSLGNQSSPLQSSSNLQSFGDEEESPFKKPPDSNQTPAKIFEQKFEHNLNLRKNCGGANATAAGEHEFLNRKLTKGLQRPNNLNNSDVEQPDAVRRDDLEVFRDNGSLELTQPDETKVSRVRGTDGHYNESRFETANRRQDLPADCLNANQSPETQMNSFDLKRSSTVPSVAYPFSHRLAESSRSQFNHSLPGNFPPVFGFMDSFNRRNHLPGGLNSSVNINQNSGMSPNGAELENERLKKELSEKCELISMLQNENSTVKQELNHKSSECEKLKKTSTKWKENDRMVNFFARELELMDSDLTKAIKCQKL